MNRLSRRGLLAGASAFAVSGLAARVHAAMGPNDKFDLLITGGEVLDPSQGLRAKRDVGIRYGLVEAVEADIPATRALRVLNASGKLTNIVQNGRLLPAALAAKRRGVVFDVGHGGGSFDYTIAEAAIAQGAGPDVISSDIHVFSGNSPGMPYLTWVMSKFLNMGFALEQVVAMATVNPARVINRLPKLGTLQTGAPGDVSILEVVEGAVEFVDTRNNKRAGKVHLRPAQAVLAGVPFGRPYQAPFSVR